MGVSDTNRPPNYALIYFMLSNINFVPKHGDFRKDELETVSLQTLEKPHNRKNNLHVVG